MPINEKYVISHEVSSFSLTKTAAYIGKVPYQCVFSGKIVLMLGNVVLKD